MSLLEMQNLLARILTDENLRREFQSAPEKIGLLNNLEESEIEQLKQIVPAELNFFSRSLVHKRRHEVEKFLPLTRRALGKDFAEYFDEFANQFLPSSIKKHLEDAIEFSRFLRKKKIEHEWAKDLAEYEIALREFNFSGRRFLLKKFDYDVREIKKEISRPGSGTDVKFEPKKTYAFLLRINGRTFFIFR
jgi:hypothetical protein